MVRLYNISTSKLGRKQDDYDGFVVPDGHVKLTVVENVPPVITDTEYLEKVETIDVDLLTWTVSYVVHEYTEQQLIQRFEGQIAAQRASLLEDKKQQQAMDSFQAIEDEAEAFDLKEAFPLWNEEFDYLSVPTNYKVTRIVIEENQPVLALFFLIQPHTPAIGDSSFLPENAPALWSRVIIGDGGYEVWTQPTGGDGKYPYIDPSTGEPYRVIHNGFLWENNHQGSLNVWVPGEFGWTNLGEI